MKRDFVKLGFTLTPELITAALGALIAPAIGYAAMPKRKETDPLLPRILALLGLGALGGGIGYLGGRYVPRLFTKAEPAPAEPAPAAAAAATAAATTPAATEPTPALKRVQTFNEWVNSNPWLREYVRAMSDEEQEAMRRLYNRWMSREPLFRTSEDLPSSVRDLFRKLRGGIEGTVAPITRATTDLRRDIKELLNRRAPSEPTTLPDTPTRPLRMRDLFSRLSGGIEGTVAPIIRATTDLKRDIEAFLERRDIEEFLNRRAPSEPTTLPDTGFPHDVLNKILNQPVPPSVLPPKALLEQFERYQRGGIEGR